MNPTPLSEAYARAQHVVDALRFSDAQKMRSFLGQEISFDCQATSESLWGFGYDLRFEDVYIRVYGEFRADLHRVREIVGLQVRVTGKLIGAHPENRILALLVGANGYEELGST